MKKILTAVQPTNDLTLGNFLGAINELKSFQQSNDVNLFIADLHTITVPYDTNKLESNVYKTLATYLACGIDPKETNIFLQSSIPEHCELKHLLSPFVSYGDLTRMHQFKDKQNGKYVPLALLDYPVLMAADILLYNPDIVPVGQDQIQHIELMKDIATRFNQKHHFFNIPNIHLSQFAKIYSLQEPTKKMSKSDANVNATIFLTDSKDTIIKKLKKATTDSFTNVEYSTNEERQGLKNLLDLYMFFTKKSQTETLEYFQNKQYGHLKVELGELLGDYIDPISSEIKKLLEDKNYLKSILNQGFLNVKPVAESNIKRIKNVMGFNY